MEDEFIERINAELQRIGYLTEKSPRIPGVQALLYARTPAGRWGAPEDLAGIAVFLCSKASDFVTGTAIPVDGGYAVQG